MPTPSRPNSNVLLLVVVAGLDAALQSAVLWLPGPFAGIGLVGFALLPLVLAWYLFVLVVIFAGGVRIDVCRRGDRLCGGDPTSVARREAFGRFAREHVLGKDVSVTLTPRSFFRYEGGAWCANGQSAEKKASGFPGRYLADVSLRGHRLTVSDKPPSVDDFP